RRHRFCAVDRDGRAGRTGGTAGARQRRRRLPRACDNAGGARRRAARRCPELAASVGRNSNAGTVVMLEKMQEAATPGVGRMADKVEEVARGGEAAAYREREEQSFERAKTILSELLDATRSAAETILDDQKRRTAERVSGMAEAVRCAAQSLDRSEYPAIARYADQAADRIEDFSGLIRERRWREIRGRTEDLARRQH